MGCACTKNLKTEAEVDFEQKNENNEENLINNTSNFYEVENNNEQNNDNLKNKGQKPKSLINSTTKDDNLNNQNLEKDDKNNNPYKQINSDKITKEELNDLLSKYEPFNDNIIVEIQPTTLCEKEAVYYGEWDKKNNFRHGRGIQVWPDNTKYIGQWKENQARKINTPKWRYLRRGMGKR